MASRTEQKAAARAAREAKQAELNAAQTRRQRFMMLGGIVGVALVALVIVIIAGSSGGGKPTLSKSAQASAVALVNRQLAGIQQNGNVLGDPKAKVTITEWGDLVCPTCAAFATTTEPQIITALVKTGQAKLVFRSFETASSYANGSQYVNTQVAAKSAGLQHKLWNYVLLTYQEQPASIGGTPAEEVAYITTAYLQSLAAQIKGLNLTAWQSNMTNPALASAVSQDGSAGTAAGVTGTPGVIVTGPHGGPLTATSAVPTLAEVQSLVRQVS